MIYRTLQYYTKKNYSIHFKFFIMKTIFFKTVMPLLAILFAVVSSFTVHASEMKTQQTIPGYATTNAARPCEITIICSNNPQNPVCIVIIGSVVYQVFGRVTISVPVPCTIILYRVNL